MTTSPQSTTPNFLANQGSTSTIATNESTRVFGIAANCTAVAIYVVVNATALPTDNLTFTLRKNQTTDTAITVTLLATATTASATGLSVALAAGDVLSMKVVQSNNNDLTTCRITVAVAVTHP
jgi:hypothetical protein